MAAVTLNEMDQTEVEERTWWTKGRVPAAPVILGIAIVALAFAYAFWQQSVDRHEARQANCEVQAEFRSFFTDYLADQIGTPMENIGGFDELSPEAKAFALQLAPIIERERQEDKRALAEYIAKFPIPTCRGL
jgi:hypothetical protein